MALEQPVRNQPTAAHLIRTTDAYTEHFIITAEFDSGRWSSEDNTIHNTALNIPPVHAANRTFNMTSSRIKLVGANFQLAKTATQEHPGTSTIKFAQEVYHVDPSDLATHPKTIEQSITQAAAALNATHRVYAHMGLWLVVPDVLAMDEDVTHWTFERDASKLINPTTPRLAADVDFEWLAVFGATTTSYARSGGALFNHFRGALQLVNGLWGPYDFRGDGDTWMDLTTAPFADSWGMVGLGNGVSRLYTHNNIEGGSPVIGPLVAGGYGHVHIIDTISQIYAGHAGNVVPIYNIRRKSELVPAHLAGHVWHGMYGGSSSTTTGVAGSRGAKTRLTSRFEGNYDPASTKVFYLSRFYGSSSMPAISITETVYD